MKGLRRAVRAMQAVLPRGGEGVTVFCYHLVEGGTDSPVDLPLDLFKRHMEELAAGARVVPLGEALLPPEDGRPRAVLTFDDAYANFARKAFPVLSELSLPSTLFVPVDFLDGRAGAPNRLAPLPPMSWAELAELYGTGLVEVGSHGCSHRPLTGLPEGDVRAELSGSRARIEDALSRSVSSFSYPGARWSRRVEARVAELYDRAVIGGGRKASPRRTSPYRIERISPRRDGPESLIPVLEAGVWLEERLADMLRRRGIRPSLWT